MFVVMGFDDHTSWLIDWSGNIGDCIGWKSKYEKEHPGCVYKIFKLEEVSGLCSTCGGVNEGDNERCLCYKGTK